MKMFPKSSVTLGKKNEEDKVNKEKQNEPDSEVSSAVEEDKTTMSNHSHENIELTKRIILFRTKLIPFKI